MARLCLPDSAVRGVDIKGARLGFTTSYTPGRDGTVTVDNPAHEKALRQLGAFAANLGGAVRHSSGYRCANCGHGSYFARCGKCGTTCKREDQ
ncbi:hypothetical protein [Streptomyces sp. NRRL S-350]|uniref:hypothetical protein n=1 Tax=Streptomyces sp. NRRL S-350 TaxID=1463902 RepID=UPI0004C0D18F|nr:hypothetical protein [Streptomyces sp. NRRL S-350]